MEVQRIRAIGAKNSLASLQTQWQNDEALRTKAEPEETYWDKGTQTEDEVLGQYLPPKKRPIQIEGESP